MRIGHFDLELDSPATQAVDFRTAAPAAIQAVQTTAKQEILVEPVQQWSMVEKFRRGQQVITADEAARRAGELLPLHDFGLTWGGLALASEEATTHFCVVGATGSGKTTLLRLLMQSALPLIGAEYKEKSHTTDENEVTPPTSHEWDEYNARLDTYNAYLARYTADVKKNEEAIALAEKHNLEIKNRNEEITSERIQLEKEIDSIPEPQRSSPGLWKWVVAVPGTVVGILAFGVAVLAVPFLLLVVGIPAAVLIVGLISNADNNGRLQAHRASLLEKKKLLVPLLERDVPELLVMPDLLSTKPEPPKEKVTVTRKAVDKEKYSGEGHRAMIYDAKGDIVSILEGMALSCPIEILNPFDARATAWDIAKDVTTPVSTRQFATILIPEDKKASQPFFANSARDLVAQSILALIQLKPEAWTLRDLLLTLQTPETLVKILSKTSQGKIKIKTYFEDEKTRSNILSEITTHMSPFESVAQAWSHCDRKISLTEWIKSESILVLGTSEEHRAALDPINRVLFQRATELTLAQSESATRRTWFYLDEVRNAGNLESLGRLMTTGRSKGACVVLGFQDIEGMRDAFGKERANELIGQCANKVILRLNSPETAEWASKLFGKYEFMEDETGENTGASKTSGKTKTEGTTEGDTRTTGTTEGTTSGTTTGTSETFGTSRGRTNSVGSKDSSNSWQTGDQKSTQTSDQKSAQASNQTSESVALQKSTQSSTADNTSDTESWTRTINKKRMEKDALLASEFMTLPVTNPRNGLHGYYLLPSIGAFYGVLDGGYIKGSLMPPDKQHPDYVPRPPSEQYLKEWTRGERKALGIPAASSATSAKRKPRATAATAAETGISPISPERNKQEGPKDGGIGRFGSIKMRPIRDSEFERQEP